MAIKEIISFFSSSLLAAPAQKGDVTLQHAHQTDAPVVRDVIALGTRPQWWMAGDLGKRLSDIVQTDFFRYLPVEDHMKIAKAHGVLIFCTLELLPRPQRIKRLLEFFGSSKNFLQKSFAESKEHCNDTVNSFIQKAISTVGNRNRTDLIADIESSGLKEPRRFLFSAALSGLSNLNDYPTDLAEECIAHVKGCMYAVESDSMEPEADPKYQLQQALKTHPLFNKQDKSTRIRVCTSLIRQLPELHEEIQLEAFELIQILKRSSEEDPQVLKELVQTLPRLPGDIQNMVYTDLHAFFFYSTMQIDDVQSIFILLIERLPTLDSEVQSNATSRLLQSPVFQEPEILKSFLEILPNLEGDILDNACSTLVDIAGDSAWQARKDLNVFEALSQKLPKLPRPAQRKTLMRIQEKHTLHCPQTLQSLVQLLPYLDTDPHSDGGNVQHLAYSIFGHILNSDALKSLATSKPILIETVKIYKDLSALQGSSQVQQRVQDIFADQLMRFVGVLNNSDPGPVDAINERSILLSTASVWAAMATDVYPFLSEARKGKMKTDIDVVFIKWIAMLSTNRGYFENRQNFIELAPAASAALTHVYSNVTRPNTIHLAPEVIKQYKEWATQQDELGNASQCFLDAWHNPTQHSEDGAKV